MNSNLVIRKDASESVLTILIWSVFSVLGTRLFLKIMNYPEIGKGAWHVSHAALGGAIMIIGVLIMLIFEGKKVRNTALITFAMGTGLFIDEIGKYLTKDYNYFFQPAIIFIYVFFVSLFLIYRYLRRYEIRRDKSKWKTMVRRVASVSYDKIFKRKLVMIGLWGYSIYYAFDKFADIFRITTSRQKMVMIEKYYKDFNFFGPSDIYMIVGQMIFDVLASILFLMGARYFWSNKRLQGIRFFKYGIYVSILLGSIFRFYFEQFRAITDLVLGMVILEMLNQYKTQPPTPSLDKEGAKTT